MKETQNWFFRRLTGPGEMAQSGKTFQSTEVEQAFSIVLFCSWINSKGIKAKVKADKWHYGKVKSF